MSRRDGETDARGGRRTDTLRVYRLIFLLVAVDRNLLHPRLHQPARASSYTEGYSLARLRDQESDARHGIVIAISGRAC